MNEQGNVHAKGKFVQVMSISQLPVETLNYLVLNPKGSLSKMRG